MGAIGRLAMILAGIALLLFGHSTGTSVAGVILTAAALRAQWRAS